MPDPKKSGEVILEYTRIGNSIRVTAVHADTGTEVVFQAPASASTSDLKQIAINKLNYVLKKRKA